MVIVKLKGRHGTSKEGLGGKVPIGSFMLNISPHGLDEVRKGNLGVVLG